MRKFQQAKILELLQTLKEANNELKQQTSAEVYCNLLADMQDFALQIGEYIESVAGEGTNTVMMLEEFCTIIYEAYQNQSAQKYIKWLKTHLCNIENSVRSELRPDKIEVVFFPYQLSMWDSLESVYVAAKADPNCDVYVVPIPWFDKQSNGEFGTMHYDGDQYPANISITNWQEYDVETRHPDVIYIHNCYDADNYVTSVHPDFYSKRLREYTDLLVYVSYFISDNDIEEHFCTTPACVYAHKTILQSEKIRETYIRVFKKNFGTQYGNPKDKFVALGSPKIDAVINAKPENFALPEEWHNLIYNADGTKKKVILYNTSVAGILQWNEKYIKKLQHVLNIFKGVDDVILWWRPHPLSEATYKSMRPQLFNEFEKLINELKTKKFPQIILDQTTELHRAIAMSDLYYGDGTSSLIPLYKITGKPILLQNVNVFANYELNQEYLHSDIVNFGIRILSIADFKENNSKCYENLLPYQNVKQHNKYIALSDFEYGTSTSINAIYKLDFNEGKANYFKSFPNDDLDAGQYSAPTRIGNKILFSPFRKCEWLIYDLDTNSWTREAVPKEYHPTNKWRYAFLGFILFNKDLIFYPGESGAIAKYNIETGIITYHREWYKKIKNDIKNVDLGIISNISVYGDNLLLFSSQSNIVTEINPDTMCVVRTYCIGGKFGFKHALLLPKSDIFYLIKYRDQEAEDWVETLIKWNIRTGETKEFINLPINSWNNNKQNLLNRSIYWKKQIYILPFQGDAILKVDFQTDEITNVSLNPKYNFFERKSDFYRGWADKVALPYLIFNFEQMQCTVQLSYDYSLAEIDLETGDITNRRKWFIEGAEKFFKQKGKQEPNVFIENAYFNIKSLLDDLCLDSLALIKRQNENNSVEIDNTEKSVLSGKSGETIHNYIKRLTGV